MASCTVRTLLLLVLVLASGHLALGAVCPGPSEPTAAAGPSPVRADQPVPEGDFFSLCLPLKRAGNLFLVEARVDSVVGNFILDFGAPYLVLNKTYFRHYPTKGGTYAAGVGGAAARVDRTTVERLELEILYYQNVPADLADLGGIENRRGVKILGLMGLDLFLDFAVTIDPLQDALTLQRLDGEGLALDPDGLDHRSPQMQTDIKVRDNSVFLMGRVGGKKVQFMLDTGAEMNVLDNDNPSKVLDAMRIERRIPLHGSAGGQTEALAGTLPELDLGGRIFPGGKTIITDLDGLGKAVSGGVQGMLGYAFLSQGVVRLNFKNSTLSWYTFVEGRGQQGCDAPLVNGGKDFLRRRANGNTIPE